MTDDRRDYRITVKRIGTDDEPLHDEYITATRIDVEHRASDIWNERYCMQPGRFRLQVRESGNLVMTID